MLDRTSSTSPRQTTKHCKGFGLVDVLIAITLLAVVLLGACSTLLQAMRAAHAAMLQIRAVDLAADFAEDVRQVHSAAQATPLLQSWRERVRSTLPVGIREPSEFATATVQPADAPAVPRLDLQLRWHDPVATAGELHFASSIPFQEPLP